MKTPNLQRLPLGRSSFSAIRKDNCLYVDKTEYAYSLITQGYRYFLSRPRRFGKSLFVSTLKEILEGNKQLFNGLWIEKSDYQWHQYGVIVLDFSAIKAANPDSLSHGICALLQNIANNYELNLTLDKGDAEHALLTLVEVLYKNFGRVVVLVDEYDSPILKHLNKSELAGEMRDTIRSFFAAIKSHDEQISFVFITGVSSFAKAGLFSGLNNLQIMTLDEKWATICGYTDQEIDHYFAPHIQAWADKENISYGDLRSQIKDWYNGYRFGAVATPVYNPFSFMSAINMQEYENFWFATGTPTFLIKELEKVHRSSEMRLLELESIEITKAILGSFDVGKIPLSALMFQTGYLTITSFNKEEQAYRLGYPNYEVRTAAQKYLLAIYTNSDIEAIDQFSLKLIVALKQKNIFEVVELIKSQFARVAYSSLMNEERFYHGMMQMLFGVVGLKVCSEIMTSQGRIDMLVELPAVNYILELKFNQSAQKALAQIEERKYYDALRYQNKPIVLLGLNFKRKAKEFEITYAAKEM